jgi:hypothetical protein
VRFDLNDYSVPHTHVRRTLTVVASSTAIRVVDGVEVIATHVRSYDRGQQIEHREHVDALVAWKRKGSEHRALDRLHHAVPRSRDLLRIVADRGGNVGRTVWGLTQLLERHPEATVDAAVAEAMARETPHVGAVRQALDRARQLTGEPPPVSLHLPADARLDAIVARPHALSTYDQLRKANDDV